MHFSSIVLPLMAAFTTVSATGGTVKVFSDSKCKNLIQTVTLVDDGSYHCYEFTSQTAKSAIISKGISGVGFNVWDNDYCAGDMAGSPSVLGQCITPAEYGLLYFKSAHISPRNTAPQPGS